MSQIPNSKFLIALHFIDPFFKNRWHFLADDDRVIMWDDHIYLQFYFFINPETPDKIYINYKLPVGPEESILIQFFFQFWKILIADIFFTQAIDYKYNFVFRIEESNVFQS